MLCMELCIHIVLYIHNPYIYMEQQHPVFSRNRKKSNKTNIYIPITVQAILSTYISA